MNDETLNILLVEDDQAHAELVQRAFERQGNTFCLSIAQTISEATALIETTPFSLILTDWRLPDGEGTSLINLQQEKNKIPVVIMTSHGNERVAVDAIKAGALDYVVKSDAALADMVHTAERALREWDNRVQRARAENQLKLRVAELEAVNRVSKAMRTAESLHEMIPRLMDETLAILNAQAGIFWLYNSFSGSLERVIARGRLEQVPDQKNPEENIAYTALTTGQIYNIKEFSQHPNGKEIPPGLGGVCLPILTAKDVIGVILIGVKLPRELGRQELNLLTTLSEIAGNAIQRTRLHEQTERNLKKLAALRAIDQAITSSVDLNLSLNILAEHAKTQLDVDAVSILRLDPDTQYLEFFTGRGFRDIPSSNTKIRLGDGLAGLAALEHRSIYTPDLTDFRKTPGIFATSTSEFFHSYYVAPMITKGLVKGVIEVFQRKPLQPNPEWKDFIEALAGQAAIAIENSELFQSLEQSNMELIHAYNATIEGWSRALDLRDRETEGHTKRVTKMAFDLAKAIGVENEGLVHLRRGALLHDIGKVGIPDQILFKEGPLDKYEWEIMRKHPVYAYEMLSPIKYLAPALDIPYCHHEAWDGSGYPRGLKGEQIPLAARIFAVADVWDALCSDRPYRDAWSHEDALAYISKNSGTRFDPQIVKVFLSMVEKEPSYSV
jgi:putative nucleotidyltransferase with HDIG domain